MMRRLDLELPPGHFCTFASHHVISPRPKPLHTHTFHEFFWVEKGAALHWINGRKVAIGEGDLIVIRAQDCHGFGVAPDGSGAQIVNFAFFARIWSDFRRRYFAGAPVFFSEPSLAARSYQLEPHQLSAIQVAAQHLRAGSRRRIHVETFLLSTLTLLQELRFRGRQDSLPAPRWIAQSCDQLRHERQFAGGMPALSRLAGRSPEHIAREFRRHLGRTPTEVINEARMSYAADRLATSEEQIADIAYDCGLENLGHFYRLFRGYAGCTPRHYRLQQQAVLRPGAARRY